MKQQHRQKQKESLQKQRDAWEVRMSLPVLISAVLFTLDLVFIQNLVQDSNLIGWRIVALTLFAIALPCIAANAFIMHWMRSMKTVLPGKTRLFLGFQLTGYVASIAGVWASITGASWWIGLIFAGMTIAACSICFNALEALRKQEQQPNPPTSH